MKNIVVLCGGKSAEHEVSLLSSKSVLSKLDRNRFCVSVLGIKKDGSTYRPDELTAVLGPLKGETTAFPAANRWFEHLAKLDRRNHVVFPVLHGPFGEDGTVQGLLEVFDLPYVGASVGGSAVGMNKSYCKAILEAAGLPVLPAMTVSIQEWKEDRRRVRQTVADLLGLPVFVKPANMGSSIGVSKVVRKADFDGAIGNAFSYDEFVLIERGIDAREIEVSVLGSFKPRVSVAGEIIPSDDFYSYNAKYIDGQSRLLIPAPLEANVAKRVAELAGQAFMALQLDGMARVDFLVDKKSDEIWLNEPNTIPGFTEISMYPKLWEASGLSYTDLLSELVELAIARHQRRSRLRVDH